MPGYILLWFFCPMTLLHIHIGILKYKLRSYHFHSYILTLFYLVFCKPSPQIRSFGLCLIFPYYKQCRRKYHYWNNFLFVFNYFLYALLRRRRSCTSKGQTRFNHFARIDWLLYRKILSCCVLKNGPLCLFSHSLSSKEFYSFYFG